MSTPVMITKKHQQKEVKLCKKEIICAGEVLFDMISKEPGKTVGDTERFEKRIGGSPFNICCGLARLGESVSFFSQIADDSFGKTIKGFLKDGGIDMKILPLKKGQRTLSRLCHCR